MRIRTSIRAAVGLVAATALVAACGIFLSEQTRNVDGVTYELLGEMPMSPEAASALTMTAQPGIEFWTHPDVPQRELILLPGSGDAAWQFFVSTPGYLPVAACALLAIDFERPMECAPQFG